MDAFLNEVRVSAASGVLPAILVRLPPIWAVV